MAIETLGARVETVTVPIQDLTDNVSVANVKLVTQMTGGEDNARVIIRIQGDIAAIICIIGITIDTENIGIPDMTTGIADICIPGLNTGIKDICILGLTIDIKDICTRGLITGIIGPEKIGKLFCHQIV